MHKRVLLVFPDTNVFLHCKQLTQLDWADWPGYDEIHIVVCIVVQRELDKLKSSPSNRIRKRARKINKLIRDELLQHGEPRVIRESNPKVVFAIDALLRPSRELESTLDFQNPDDSLVGIVHAKRIADPTQEILLVTDDTGVMATANALNVPFGVVPTEWRLEPEPSPEELEIASLRGQLAELQTHVPELEIQRMQYASTGRLELQTTTYSKLSEREIADAIEELKKQFPHGTPFSSASEMEPDSIGEILTPEELGVNNSDKVISFGHKYHEWTQSCREVLERLDKSLAVAFGFPSCEFKLKNVGNVPAEKVLIRFTAEGPFRLMRPFGDCYFSPFDEPKLEYPAPPLVEPREYERALRKGPFLGIELPRLNYMGDLGASLNSNFPERRDPDLFYYKGGGSSKPTESLELESEQFRHGHTTETFACRLIPLDLNNECQGLLRFQVHAANLDTPVESSIPVTVTSQQKETAGYLPGLIERLTELATLGVDRNTNT